MLQTVSNPTQPESPLGRRAGHLRARDPYFDALCESYDDLNTQIARIETARPGRAGTELLRLKRQRQEFLDTIAFLLDDHATGHRLAA